MSVSIILLIIVIPLLVLFIKLSIKRPGLAAIIALVPIILFVLFYFTKFSHIVPYDSTAQMAQPSASLSQYSNVQTPIWSEGIENELSADVYPSKTAAVRSLGRQIKRPVKLLLGDQKIPNKIFVLQDEKYPELIDEFAKIVRLEYPEILCEIINVNSYSSKPDLPDEVSMLLKIVDTKETASWQENSFEPSIAGKGRIEAFVAVKNGNSTISVQFIEKPWVENFSLFTNQQSNKQYIVAKSNESCLTPGEADQQAIDNACNQVGPLILMNLKNPAILSTKDILNSGMVIDKFLQSFNGSNSQIWREAILLDVSSQKLNHLAATVSGASRARLNSWAKMIGSIFGLFVLITIVYAFLNAATRGYYSLTLKIVGIILAAIFLFVIFHFRYGIGLGNGGM